MRVLLAPEDLEAGLSRMADEVARRLTPAETGVPTLLVGVRRGGTPVAARVAALVQERTGRVLPVGSVDINLYRDDAATALPNPRIGPSELPFALDGAVVVLVDDVVSTGRTVRAAIDAILDYGRPRRIELLALLDRGGRELPIQPDYLGHRVEVAPDEHVSVTHDGGRLQAIAEAMTPRRPAEGVTP